MAPACEARHDEKEAEDMLVLQFLASKAKECVCGPKAVNADPEHKTGGVEKKHIKLNAG